MCAPFPGGARCSRGGVQTVHRGRGARRQPLDPSGGRTATGRVLWCTAVAPVSAMTAGTAVLAGPERTTSAPPQVAKPAVERREVGHEERAAGMSAGCGEQRRLQHEQGDDLVGGSRSRRPRPGCRRGGDHDETRRPAVPGRESSLHVRVSVTRPVWPQMPGRSARSSGRWARSPSGCRGRGVITAIMGAVPQRPDEPSWATRATIGCRLDAAARRSTTRARGASLVNLGLVLTALALGLRHGIDWDHIAAIADLTSASDNRRRGIVLSLWYAVGHAAVVLVSGPDSSQSAR